MAAVGKKVIEKYSFSGQKNSKNQNFHIVLVPAIAIYVTNMWLKFREDRSSSFKENYNTTRKNMVLRKTRLKFFSMENCKKIVLLLRFFDVVFFSLIF